MIAFIELNSTSPQAVSDIAFCIASSNQHTLNHLKATNISKEN